MLSLPQLEREQRQGCYCHNNSEDSVNAVIATTRTRTASGLLLARDNQSEDSVRAVTATIRTRTASMLFTAHN